jgi:hypothetical protein
MASTEPGATADRNPWHSRRDDQRDEHMHGPHVGKKARNLFRLSLNHAYFTPAEPKSQKGIEKSFPGNPIRLPDQKSAAEVRMALKSSLKVA